VDQDKLDDVVSSIEFWQSCYDRGVGSTVASDLLGMRGRTSPAFEDARRFLTSHHPELLANPDSLLERISCAPAEPSSARVPSLSLRSVHNVLSGLEEPEPGEDQHWPAQRVAVGGRPGTDALAVALSRDNALMATACWTESALEPPPASVTFWDALDGHNLGALPSFHGKVSAMVFSPAGDTLAVAQAGKSVVLLFEPASGAELGALHGHGGGLLQSGAVNALCFSGPSPSAPVLLASASDDKMGAL
jgi:WD40 repeat protein